MITKKLKTQAKGQALVEFVLVLPFLIVLFLGLIETGYAMYDYIVLSNANREGVRLAARGRFDDEVIKNRIIGAGGYRNGQLDTPNLNLDENFGMIITHLRFPSEDISGGWAVGGSIDIQICCQPDCPVSSADVSLTRCVMGSIADNDAMRTLMEADSRIVDLNGEFDTNVAVSNLINDLRDAEDYDRQMNELAIVETFMAHSTLLNLPEFLPLDDPMNLYFRSSMRVTLNSRTGNTGP